MQNHFVEDRMLQNYVITRYVTAFFYCFIIIIIIIITEIFRVA